ncbi:MAG: site-specific integrase [Muribaculaceae bacterium]|nr:site-specific integrase [Muribaculaceae bacterium]
MLCTRYKQERPDIQRAFVFSLYTGIRFCDVKRLTYGNVDFSSRTLWFNQVKSEGRSARSAVVMPLSDDLMDIIGFPRNPAELSELIFPLPDTSICRRHLAEWVKQAGINKHITWHCARHSLAVNVLNAGANIKTVSSLLGHSSIKMTEKYLHVLDNQKKDAMNSLGRISFRRDSVFSREDNPDFEV